MKFRKRVRNFILGWAALTVVFPMMFVYFLLGETEPEED